MSDDTEAIYAWADEPDEGATFDAPQRAVVAIAALAAVALALASVAAVVSLLTPPREPDHYSIRPAPIEQAPAPTPAPPRPTVEASPPVHRLAPPAPKPDANQRFQASLAQGQMWQNTPDDDHQARQLCRDLANGGSVNDYITGTEAKSPQLTPQEAAQVVRDAVQAYCPQFNR
jgi:hypothetical protein